MDDPAQRVHERPIPVLPRRHSDRVITPIHRRRSGGSGTVPLGDRRSPGLLLPVTQMDGVPNRVRFVVRRSIHLS